MTEAVLDASALVAFLRDEPGAERVRGRLGQLRISAVNLAETLSKMVEYGKPLDLIAHQVERLKIPVVSFDGVDAKVVAFLRPVTRHAGLSLGDRACLALALARQEPVLTTERTWAGLGLHIPIEVIR